MRACVYESSVASAYSFGLATNPNQTRARSYPLNINPNPTQGCGSRNICGFRVGFVAKPKLYAEDLYFRTTGVAAAKRTVTHFKHFNVSPSEVQSFVNNINIWLAGKYYITTMLFDSCRVHIFKSSHMRLCVLFFPNSHECNIIYFFFSLILTLSPSRFAGLFYCCSLLITVFAFLTVVNMWGEMKYFVAMNYESVTMT